MQREEMLKILQCTQLNITGITLSAARLNQVFAMIYNDLSTDGYISQEAVAALQAAARVLEDSIGGYAATATEFLRRLHDE